jgi:protein-tyrosine phosphatase
MADFLSLMLSSETPQTLKSQPLTLVAHSWTMLKGWLGLQPRIGEDAPPTADTNAPTVFYPFDMHSHLLPGVDDGVKELDDALTCLSRMADWGIRHVIATPHISQDYYPNTSADLRARVAAVQAAIDDRRLPITFGVAAEYMLDELFDERLRANDLLSFGTERFVLVETGWASAPRQLEQWLFQLQLLGYVPVLAHPERYSYYRTDEQTLEQLREKGCLFQLNLMSLAGRYGSDARRMAHRLIRLGWVDMVSSDLHGVRDLNTLEEAFHTNEYRQLRQLPLRIPTF